MNPPQVSRSVYLGLLVTAIVVTAAVRCMPMFSSSALQRTEHTYVAEDGRRYPYLLERDTYSWLRKARNHVEKGTACEAFVEGRCWDTLTLAPYGDVMPYADSLHIRGIAWLHRAIRVFRPNQPLEVSAFFLQVLLGTLAVVPAWFLGLRLGGPWGAWASTLLIGLHPVLLFRSVGGDNDVWSLTLTLSAACAVVEGLTRSSVRERAVFGAVAGLALGLHALAWSGWLFAAAFLGGSVMLCAAWIAVRGVVLRAWSRAWAELEGYLWFTLALCAVLVVVLGPQQLIAIASEYLVTPQPGGRAGIPVPLPSALRHVAEAKGLPKERVIALLGELRLAGGLVGLAWLVGAWGCLRRGERVVPVLAAVAGVGALLWLDTSALTVAKITLAPVGALFLWKLADRRSEDWLPPVAVVVLIAWVALTLRLTDGVGRFISLASVPLGLALGAALGDAAQRVAVHFREGSARTLLAGVLALGVLQLSREGVTLAREARPPLTTTWHGALQQLERSSPPDAIVHAFWGYGYWIQYFAHRAVAADGASLLKRIPHWTSRALMADDPRAALGVLRMLSCGSDFTDALGRDHGASELVKRTVPKALAAHELLLGLLDLGPKQAAAHLAVNGFSAQASAELLAATHCAPRPSYLMLSDEQALQTDLRYQGLWDHRKAFVLALLRTRPKANVLAAMRNGMKLSEADAEDLYARAERVRGAERKEQFISQVAPAVYLPRCSTEGDQRVCAILPAVGQPASAYGVLRFPVQDPLRAELESVVTGKRRAPSTVVLGSGAEVTTHVLDPSAVGGTDDYAVLIDQAAGRVVVGSTAFVRSVFSRLMFLPGYPLPGFERVDERSGERERVMTYRLQFPAE